MLSVALIVSGALLVFMAIRAEQHAFDVWANYSKNYKPHPSKLLDRLYRPSYIVYRIHVYLFWPLLAAIGAAAFVLGILRLVL